MTARRHISTRDRVRWHLAPRYGLLWVRVSGKRCWLLKAPWCRPLFSERYGLDTWPQRRLGGWRWGWRDEREIAG